MVRKTITQKVLEYLKEKSGNPNEIAKALNLKVRKNIHGLNAYYWGDWSFHKAEEEGIIEYKNEQWYLKT